MKVISWQVHYFLISRVNMKCSVRCCYLRGEKMSHIFGTIIFDGESMVDCGRIC